MTRRIGLLYLAPAALLACATPASSTTITFEGHQLNTVIGSTYADLGVVFTNARFASAQGLPGTGGLVAVYTQTGNYYSYGLPNAVAGTFTTAANYLSFAWSDVGFAGITLEAFNSLGVSIASSSFIGVGLGKGSFGTVQVAADGISSFKVYQPNFNNQDGMIVDTMTFTLASLNFGLDSSVPEPASWAMMVAGFGLLGAAMRRRPRTTVRLARIG